MRIELILSSLVRLAAARSAACAARREMSEASMLNALRTQWIAADTACADGLNRCPHEISNRIAF